ncbi:hypothetical protein [Brevibacillus sp. HB2.2]|uniref:hypothetical protein n=1 Tax=Brevibacillus sp. HB2.2 TaxID=2738846 RepID=UPI00156B3AA3|nr:hypothetical protein [Brevibacillus sp. HB2.2]NRS50951.1 hypothetical protein [Brevibacillus sp. HB2.2]
MKEWLTKNKKSVLLILTGVLGIVGGTVIGFSEDLQLQIVSIFDQLLSGAVQKGHNG